MLFPIKIQKCVIFLRHNKNWLNVNIEIAVHGGGIKGFCRFTYNLIRCMFDKHLMIGKGSFKGQGRNMEFERYTACWYCDKREDKNE